MDTDEGNTLKGKMKVNEDSSHVILCEDHCTKIADKIADRLAEREKLRVKAEEETEFKSKLKILNERDIHSMFKLQPQGKSFKITESAQSWNIWCLQEVGFHS